MSKYQVKCPMCGERHFIELTDEQADKLYGYWHNGEHIQDVFPELNAVEREFIKTGYCPSCQEMIFGNGETSKISKCKE